jgi:hypothetical protein
MSARQRRLIGVVSLIVLLAVVLAVLAPSLYEVQDKGRGPGIVPYEGTGLIYKIRVLDTFTVYADEESRPIPDKLSSSALVATATMMLMAALLLSAAGADRRIRRFFGFAAAGLAVLAVDELFALHETIGHNLRFLADLPGVERPDDVVFLLMGLVAVAFVWSFRDVLFWHRRATEVLSLGAVFFAIAALGDVIGSGAEEPAEVASGACLLAGLILLTAATLKRELGLGDRVTAAEESARSQRRATWTTQTVRGRPS